MTVQNTTFHLLGNLINFKAVPEQTAGRFAVAEITTAPGAGAPPNHHVEEEGFLVLDGEVEFMLDGETRQCKAGDFVMIPSDKPHAFSNVGSRPSRMINITSPGNDHVGFFSQAGDSVPSGTRDFPEPTPPDVPRLTAIAARNNVHILPPPSGAQD